MAFRFSYYTLRTSDPDRAERFYADVLGDSFWGSGIRVAPLPERARALGVPSHWLGHVCVSDLDTMSQTLIAGGSEPLGPTQTSADGDRRAILRDPFGAVIGLTNEAPLATRDRVALHVHHSEDEERASQVYRTWFGWSEADRSDLGLELGRHRMFAWQVGGRPAGIFTNLATLPHVHTQWLFCLRVPDFDAAIDRVRARGGLALEPVRTAQGGRITGGDDPQGAAFALYEDAP